MVWISSFSLSSLLLLCIHNAFFSTPLEFLASAVVLFQFFQYQLLLVVNHPVSMVTHHNKIQKIFAKTSPTTLCPNAEQLSKTKHFLQNDRNERLKKRERNLRSTPTGCNPQWHNPKIYSNLAHNWLFNSTTGVCQIVRFQNNETPQNAKSSTQRLKEGDWKFVNIIM